MIPKFLSVVNLDVPERYDISVVTRTSRGANGSTHMLH